MDRYFKALIGTIIEIILLSMGIIFYTSNLNGFYNLFGLIIICLIFFILLKINYEYFESPFYKSLKYPWEK